MGRTLQKVRALLRTPKTIGELLEAGIPKASAYYDIDQLTRNDEINRIEGIDGKPRYVINSTSLVPSRETLRLVIDKMNDNHKEVAAQAINDLDALSKVTLLNDNQVIRQVVDRFLRRPSPPLAQVIRRQASRAKEIHDNETLQHYRRCVPAMRRTLLNSKGEPENRENALLFLQVMNDDELPHLAFEIISKRDAALNSTPATQFAIVIESICVSSARSEKWRRKLYDMLIEKDETIVERAKRLLELSRRSAFLTSSPDQKSA